MFLTSSHLELSFRAVSETGTSPTPARTPTLKSWLEMRTLTPANYRKFPHFAVPFVHHTIVFSSPPQYTFTAGPVKKNEFGGNGIEKKTAGPAFPVRPRPALSLPCEPRRKTSSCILIPPGDPAQTGTPQSAPGPLGRNLRSKTGNSSRLSARSFRQEAGREPSAQRKVPVTVEESPQSFAFRGIPFIMRIPKEILLK